MQKKMSTSIVNSYYLKAYEAYPWELSEVEEKLDYALAYDPEHISSLCLKSKYYLYDLGWQEEARHLAERAMAVDPRSVCAAKALLNCMIEMGALKEALRFVDYIDRKIPMKAVDKYLYMANIMELKLQFNISLNYYKRACLYICDSEQLDLVEARLKMVKQKQKRWRKLKSKPLVENI